MVSDGDFMDYGEFLHMSVLEHGYFPNERSPEMKRALQQMLNLKENHGNN